MTLKGKRIFISGGAGFIGSTMAARLVDDNQVVVFDNMSRDALSKLEIAKRSNLTVIEGDVQDFKGVLEAVRGCQIILHMAGIAGIDTVIKSPANTMHVNMAGTANLLEAARLVGECERFINFSTSEVFGSFTFRARESDWTAAGPVREARWSYAVSKLAAEHLAYAYYLEHKLPTVTVRPFNIYGPGQVGEGAIHVFVTRALQGKPLEIHGEGNQIRSWTYIDDMVEGILLCLSSDKAVGHSFNIGNPTGAISVYFLAKMILQLSGSNSKIRHVPRNFADVELRVPSINKARELIGFEPRVELEEGLQRTIGWYRKQLKRS